MFIGWWFVWWLVGTCLELGDQVGFEVAIIYVVLVKAENIMLGVGALVGTTWTLVEGVELFESYDLLVVFRAVDGEVEAVCLDW